MNIIDSGHLFLLAELDGNNPNTTPILQFVKREGEKYPGNTTHYPGTTTQEVLRACISRSIYVNNQTWSIWTWIGIQFMRLTIFVFEWRAKRVKKKWLPLWTVYKIENYQTCSKCGHILCREIHAMNG